MEASGLEPDYHARGIDALPRREIFSQFSLQGQPVPGYVMRATMGRSFSI
jgi:hypothetical protein